MPRLGLEADFLAQTFHFPQRHQAAFLPDLQLPQLPESYWSSSQGTKCRDTAKKILLEDDKKGAADDYILHHVETAAKDVGSDCKRAIRDLEGTPTERLAKIQAGVESLF